MRTFQKDLLYFKEYREYAINFNISILYSRRKLLFDKMVYKLSSFSNIKSPSYYDIKIDVVKEYMSKIQIIDEQIKDIKEHEKL